MIQAVVFDFDGLILDTESSLISAYADLHAAHGLPFDRMEFHRCVGHENLSFDPLQAFGPEVNRTALEDERRTFNRAHDLKLPILPGVIRLIDSAKEKDLRIALASNSPRNHCERHLARIGLLTHFDFLACRDDVTRPKPAPDLYQLVLDHFELGGSNAIAFEDSHTGSLAAKRAGLWCVAVPGPSTQYHDFTHVDLRVQSLADCPLEHLTTKFRR